MKNLYRSMLSVLLISAPLFSFGCAAQASSTDELTHTEQAATETVHPTPQAVTADAKFAQWIVRPDGRLGGMLLDDGSMVRVRAESVKDTSALKAGDAVHVEGFKLARGSSAIGMAKVTKDGNVIVDAPAMRQDIGKMHADKDAIGAKKHHGKKHEGKQDGKKSGLDESKLQTISSTATLARIIPSGRGDDGVSMLVLSDGTVAYAPHHGNVDVLKTLAKGDAITVSGLGGNYPLGKAMVMKSITLPSGTVQQI